MLLVEPCGAEGQLEAAVAGVVDRHRLGRQHRRVAVGRPGHEQTETDARRLPGQRRQRRHPLEGLTGALAVHGLEVVEAPGAVEAEVLGEGDPAGQLVPRDSLLGDVDPEAHGAER